MTSTPDSQSPKRDEPPRWLDNKKNVDKLFYGLVAVTGLVTVADSFYHKHGHFAFDKDWWGWGFYSVFGFLSCTLLVIVAKLLRKVVMRDEDYYD